MSLIVGLDIAKAQLSIQAVVNARNGTCQC